MNIIEKIGTIVGLFMGTIIVLFMSTVITLVSVDVWSQQLMGNSIQISMEPVVMIFFNMILMFTIMCFISYRERA